MTVRWLIVGLCLLMGSQGIAAQEAHPVRKPIMMPELMVIGTKTKYEEENPAVALLERTSRLELERRKQEQQSYSYQQVDQLTLSLSRLEKWQGFLMKVAPFFDHYLKRSKIDGSPILPLSQREKVTLKGYNIKSRETNESVIYRQLVGIDQNFNDGTNSIRLEELLPELDLFEPTVRMLNTVFPSPLGKEARESYRYYLTDTIISQGKIVQVVQFIPRHPNAPSFTGRLEITSGDTPQLLQALLVFPRMTNVNFVENLHLQQWYGEKEGRWHLVEEQLSADMKLFLKTFSANIEHNRSYGNFAYADADSSLVNAKNKYQDKTQDQSSLITASELRANQVIATDEGLRHFMDEFRKHKWQRFALELVDMIGLNYLRTGWDYNKVYGGSYFDIGPINKMAAINSVEGLRISLGGRTTGYFSRRNFLEGYGAYGFKDNVWKYGLTYAHSFNPKRYFREEYPRHEVAVSHRYDLHIPGKIIENNDRTNILYDIGVAYLASLSYRHTTSLQYLNDFNSEFSMRLYANYDSDKPQGDLDYIRVNGDGSMEKVPEIRDALLGVELRWAPGERIFEGSMQRQYYNMMQVQKEVPVYRLRHEWADRKFGGDYNRHRTELSVEQRLWMGKYGRLDYQLSVGKIWNSVPYPILFTPPANTSIWHVRNSFHLLNSLEFVADEWVTAFVQYHMRGLVFDRIPYIKKLKLRGVLTANIMYGDLTAKNRQETGEELFLLPMYSQEMTNDVYAEVGFGLENILKAIRVDVYRRVTPLTPYSKGPWGVKLGFNLSF